MTATVTLKLPQSIDLYDAAAIGMVLGTPRTIPNFFSFTHDIELDVEFNEDPDDVFWAHWEKNEKMDLESLLSAELVETVESELTVDWEMSDSEADQRSQFQKHLLK